MERAARLHGPPVTAAIKRGNDQLDRDEGVQYTPEALDDITQIAVKAMHRGQPMDPDVLP